MNKNINSAQKAIGLGGLAQISRNKKIDDIGGLFLVSGLIILVGELIKFIFRWLFIKPITLFIKFSWICLIYSAAFIKTLFQFTIKEKHV